MIGELECALAALICGQLSVFFSQELKIKSINKSNRISLFIDIRIEDKINDFKMI
jgi:hypothetical protein